MTPFKKLLGTALITLPILSRANEFIGTIKGAVLIPLALIGLIVIWLSPVPTGNQRGTSFANKFILTLFIILTYASRDPIFPSSTVDYLFLFTITTCLLMYWLSPGPAKAQPQP